MKNLPLPSLSLVDKFLHRLVDAPFAVGTPSFTYAASVMLPRTGWPTDEFANILKREIALPHNICALEQAEQRHHAGSNLPFSLSVSTSKGESVFFVVTPRPVLDASGAPTVVFSLAEQPATFLGNVLSRENTLFNFLDVLPVYVVLLDREHKICFSNRVARQFFGPMEGKACHQALFGKAKPCESCIPFGLFADNAIKVHDWIHAKKNIAFRAHSYPFETADRTRYILQVGINITAGIRARNALDMSEQRYRIIAENLTMGLALVDTELRFVTLNPKMEEWFGERAAKGASVEDVMGKGIQGEHGADEVSIFRDVLRDKENREGEFRITLSTREERDFRLVASPILARNRQVRAIVIMLEDVTDRRTLAARIQQIQRLEALGALAGGIAHEINQPLSALHLYASGMQMLLEQDAQTPVERIMERLTLILSQAEKIRSIISHMRALVMQEENPPIVPVNVADMVNEALNLVGVQLQEHGISVVLVIPVDTPFVLANPVQLEQVIINLLVNAMHALDLVEGREKIIRIAAVHVDESTFILHVMDNGIGLGTTQNRIFDPFFTTRGAYGGMGLGLSIVHAFVTSWGGSVEAANNKDDPGAAFIVRLLIAKNAKAE